MADEKPRKRLPVLGATSQDEARPGWHWAIVVALGTLFGWLLLEMIVVPAIARWVAGVGATLVMVMHLVALGLPAMGAGVLAGRLGRRARWMDVVAGAVGLVVAMAVLAVVRLGVDTVWLGAVVGAAGIAAVTAAGAAAAGFAVGRRRAKHEA